MQAIKMAQFTDVKPGILLCHMAIHTDLQSTPSPGKSQCNGMHPHECTLVIVQWSFFFSVHHKALSSPPVIKR